MGLVGLALLIILTQSLRASLGAGVIVRMQPDGPVDISGRTICLFVERAIGHPEAGTVSDGRSQVMLRIELFTPIAVNSTGSSTAATLQGSVALFFLWRSLEKALAPESGPWGVLWERFRLGLIADMYAPPLFETEKGVKIVAQVVQLTVESLSSPYFGEPSDAWSALLAQLRATGGELAPFADLLEASLTGGDFTDLQVLSAALGVSDATLIALGLDIPESWLPLPASEQSDTMSASVSDLTGGANG